MTQMEKYFCKFTKNIIGNKQTFISPYGEKKIIYADWIASGRLYAPIEKKMKDIVGPFVGNTHSESSITGTSMTKAYHQSHDIIKQHCNANSDDVILTTGFGMTACVNKFQRILGLRICEQLKKYTKYPTEKRPVVFSTHMEHHSNQTSWLETLADVIIMEPDNKGLVDLNRLEDLLKQYKSRTIKIGAFTACSNVTGIQTEYYQMARLMHEHNGLCFIDFAASAPYIQIDMHPADPLEKLDAIYFSPHKFLGGPGTSGVLIFDKNLYNLKVPDQPGGGTVDWTNPWGGHKYVNSVELREDGGTPGFLQAIRAALCIKLKEKMGSKNILKRDEELLEIAFNEFDKIPGIHILANDIKRRLGIISFYVEDVHYNLMVKLLNDRFGVQVRGGCSCAGTYGHYLLHVDPTRSKRITDKIDKGDLSEKPGWVRMSLHPTMTDEELYFIISAIKQIIKYHKKWESAYNYSSCTNEFTHKKAGNMEYKHLEDWFNLN